MFNAANQFHLRRTACALIALFCVSAGSPCLAENTKDIADDNLPTYESPYRLSHRFLLGTTSSGLLTGDKQHPGAIDGVSVGITTEYFLLPIYSLGMRFGYYHFSTSYRNSTGLGVRSIALVQKLVPAAGASFSPYLTLGLGVTSNQNASRETLSAGIGFQIRPRQQYWARIEATTIAMGLGARLAGVSIDGLDSAFQVGAYGLRLEFGIVH